MDRIGEVGDRASEGKAAWVYGTGITAGSLARIGARYRMKGLGIKAGSDKEFMRLGE